MTVSNNITSHEKTVLILDDEEAVSFTAKIIAKKAGFDVRTSQSARVFFSELEQWHPACVIIDLAMPDMDGLQILQQLSTRDFQGKIIISSGLGQRILEAAGRTADDYGLNLTGILPKPFRPEQLRTLLGAPSRREQARSRSNQPIDASMLANALEHRWIQPYFQPKIICATGQLCGFEAVARLLHPEQGLIAPDSFIPLAETTGLITPLTLQILEASLNWINQLNDLSIGLAINLSRSSTDTGFADQLMRLCRHYGIKPERITLEVTETAQHKNPKQLLEFLTRFRIQGFQLSLDDFGVGYSSLTELARLPFSEIKIDRSFVGNVVKSVESQKICSAIVGLGKAMGLEITAEGVEDAEALTFLAEIHCDKAQGYYIARPMPARDAIGWRNQHTPEDRESS